jgi:hypothetical protein
MSENQYLFMTEDGDMYSANDVNLKDLDEADQGYLDIVSLHTIPPKRWWKGEWVEIGPKQEGEA